MNPIPRLEPGETHLALHLDADDLVGAMTESQIRIHALADFLKRSRESGLEVTWGPEIAEYHRPEYPGDQTWVNVVGVGRTSRVR